MKVDLDDLEKAEARQKSEDNPYLPPEYFEQLKRELAGWKEYVEPKKKIEMWKWAHKEHHGLWGETTVHRATPPSGGDDLVRIEGSRIEVEE